MFEGNIVCQRKSVYTNAKTKRIQCCGKRGETALRSYQNFFLRQMCNSYTVILMPLRIIDIITAAHATYLNETIINQQSCAAE